jgi:hypothetical protein
MRRLFVGLSLIVIFAAGALGAHATQARPADDWIEVAGKPIQLQAVHRDPLNGQTSPLSLPLNLLPAPARDIFTTPVDVELDNFWNATASPALCNAATTALNGQGSGSFHVYNTACAFASGGHTVASVQDDAVVIDYYLPANVITAYVTTPGTCAPGHGTFLCPTDPKISLTTDIEVQATIEFPGQACDAHVDPFTVQVANVTLDSQNLTADIAFDAASLWASLTGTDYVAMAQNMISQGVQQLNANAGQTQQAVTGEVAAFTSSLCNSIIPSLPGANDFWLLTGSVDADQGIVFQLVDEPPTPSLFAPTLTPAQPTVTAGSTVKLSGQFFPSNGGTVTLTLAGTKLGTATLSPQGTFTATVTIPAGTAAGNATIRASAGTAQAQTSIQVLAKGAAASLVVSWQGLVYTAVDTDYPFTLSGANFAPGTVSIYIDSASGVQIGTATVGADGTFSHDFQVSSAQIGNHYGQHTLVAVQNGNVQASLTVGIEQPEVIH